MEVFRVTDYSQKWWALVAVGSGTLMATIDGSIVNISLNTLVNVFSSTLSAVEWVVLSYLLTITCLLLTMGRLGDMFGKRRIYLIGFVVFTLSSALCGFSISIPMLIASRVLQAIGAAMMQAVGTALLVTAFPPEERGMVLGLNGSIVALGILLGPVLGGILLRQVGWQSIFFVNIPVGVIGMWLTVRSIKSDNVNTTSESFDYIGAGLMFLSLFGLLLGLTEAPTWGWFDPRSLALFALFLIAGCGFLYWESTTKTPMLQLALLRNSAISLNLLAGLMLFMALAFNILLTPFYLQLVRNLDTQMTGFILIAQPIALSLVAPLSGRLSDRLGARGLTIMGLITAALGLFTYTFDNETSPLWLVLISLLLLGCGIGLFQSPNNSTIMGNTPSNQLGVASGLLAIVRNLGQTAGIAIAGAVWSSRVIATAGQVYDPITAAPTSALSTGYEQAMMVGAGILLLAIVPSLLGGKAAHAARLKRMA